MRNFVWFNVWFTSCLNHLPAPFRHQPRCKHSIKTIIYSLTVEPVIHYKYEMEHNDILTPLVLQLFFLNNCFEMWHADRWVPPPPNPRPVFYTMRSQFKRTCFKMSPLQHMRHISNKKQQQRQLWNFMAIFLVQKVYCNILGCP